MSIKFVKRYSLIKITLTFHNNLHHLILIIKRIIDKLINFTLASYHMLSSLSCDLIQLYTTTWKRKDMSSDIQYY